MTKGQDVIYRPRGCDFNVSATVCDTHDDGTVTVLAHYVLDDDGDAEGDFIGATYRTRINTVSPLENRAAVHRYTA